MLLWIFAVVFIIFAYYKIYKPHQYWKDKGVPYVKPWPIFGNIGSFLFRTQSMPEWHIENYNKCTGRYQGNYAFSAPFLLIKDVELLKQMAIKDFDSFINRTDLISEDLDSLFIKSLFSLKGQKWKDMRSVLSPAFTGNKIRTMFPLIMKCADQFTKYYENLTETDVDYPIELKTAFTRLMNDVIATSAFGYECDSLHKPDNEFYVHAKEISDFNGTKAIKFMLAAFSPTIIKILGIKMFNENTGAFFRHLVSSTIQYREKEEIYRPDMIHLLMEANKGRLKHETEASADVEFATAQESHIGKDTKISKPELSNDDLTAQVIQFFTGGFESTSTILSFTAYEIAVNGDVQKKLRTEIDEMMRESNGQITYENLSKMKYLDMVVSEALRKYPNGVHVDRICNKPYVIAPKDSSEKPVHLKVGDVIGIPLLGLHRDPKHFPNPDKFDPERFNEQNKKNITPGSYVPFGIGPRNCIASRFALMTIKLVCVSLLTSFDLVINEKTTIPFKFSRKKITMDAENDFWISLRRRNGH